MSSTIPFAAVTVLNGATSIGPLGATVYGLDYRWAGELTNQVTYVYSNSSIGGAGESIVVQVSPDWTHDNPNNGGAMWATYAIVSAAGGVGAVVGPWSAIRFYKAAGGSVAKVVALIAGKNAEKRSIQGT